MNKNELLNTAKVLKQALAQRKLVGGALPTQLTSTEELLCTIYDESLIHHQHELGKRRKEKAAAAQELRRIHVAAIRRKLKAQYYNKPYSVATIQEIISQLEKAGFSGAGLSESTIRGDMKFVIEVYSRHEPVR